jgi:hypothetical protein
MGARIWPIAVLLLAVGGSAAAGEPFRVALVPSRSHGTELGISTAAKDPDTFFVVLTNVSQKSEAVWETGNGWGYRVISFELTLPDGTIHHISKTSKAFTRNFPSTFIIPAAGEQVYPIQLDSSWDKLPIFPSAGETRATIRAIYEVGTSKEARQHDVWVGRLVSPNYVLKLRHW